MEDGSDNSVERSQKDEQLDELLNDPLFSDPEMRQRFRARLRELFKEDEHTSLSGNSPITPSGKEGSSPAHPTPSGKNGGAWQSSLPAAAPPCWWPHGVIPPTPFWPVAPPQAALPAGGQLRGPTPRFSAPPLSEHSLRASGSSGSSSSRKRPADAEVAELGSDSETDEDRVDPLLSESEALEWVEFNPTVDSEDSWEPPKAMNDFLEKHFNRALSPEERKAIQKDFPKPSCRALEVPKLDDQVKEHLKGKGKDPHFGPEKSLYKLQEAVLEVAGPLACLWGDLLNEEVKVSKEDTLLIIQRALVLLGNASNSISLERRKVAWARINPKLKALATEDYSKRETNLFGPGFLEKASKKLELDKTIAKVSQPGGFQSAKRARFSKDASDLRSFLSKGAPARYGGGRPQRHQPYQVPKRFQSKRYFQQSRPAQPKQRSPKSSQD